MELLNLLIAGAWGIATAGVFAWVFIGHERASRCSLPSYQLGPTPTDKDLEFYAREDVDPMLRTHDAVRKGYAPIAIVRPAIAPPPRLPMRLKPSSRERREVLPPRIEV